MDWSSIAFTLKHEYKWGVISSEKYFMINFPSSEFN